MWTEIEIETTIDSLTKEDHVIRVEAQVDIRAGELGDVTIRDAETGEEILVSEEAEKVIYEEIWEDVAQNQDYPC